MKQLLSFVKKEFYHIWRDKWTLFILLGMPIVEILIFGFALTNEVKNANIAILDNSKDPGTESLITEIESSRYFTVARYLNSDKNILDEFKKGDIKVAVVFPQNFNEDLLHFNESQVQLVADASDPNLANTLTNYLGAIISDYQKRITDERKLPYTINTEMRMLYNPQLKGAYNFVPGLIAMVLMLVCTMMTAITIVREKELGTMEVMLVSPIRPIKIIFAKAIPYLLLSIINVATIFLLSVYALEVPIKGNLSLLIFESILFTITCLSFGLLISAVTSSQETAMFISLSGMFLPTVQLSGFMFPIENLPLPLRILSNVVPSKWFYQIARDVMIKGVGFKEIWFETMILGSMTILLLIMALKKFKIRLA